MTDIEHITTSGSSEVVTVILYKVYSCGYPFGCHEWAVPISAALPQGPYNQGYNGGESLATYV